MKLSTHPKAINHCQKRYVTKEQHVSPTGYPNPYPLNVDYTIHIKAPEHHRIVVQFQRIDLEAQDDCLYDYISIQNYDVSHKYNHNSDTSYAHLPTTISQQQHERRVRSVPGTRSHKKLQHHPIQLDDGWIMGKVKRKFPPNRNTFNEIQQNRKRRRKKRDEKPSTTKSNPSMSMRFMGRRSFSVLRGIENSQSFLRYVRWCGSHDSNMSKFDFVSTTNEVLLNFHSDYSLTGLGFSATWRAIDISKCDTEILTAHDGYVTSANYNHFLLHNMNCTYVIRASPGNKLWLEFSDYDLIQDAVLEIDIGHGYFRPFLIHDHLNEGVFVSFSNQISLRYTTGEVPRGRGFRAFYKTKAENIKSRFIYLNTNETGRLLRLNYPQYLAGNIDFTQHLIAPLGYVINLELYGVEFSDRGCSDHSVLEVSIMDFLMNLN